jgi:RAP1 GTPase activating protein 1
LDIHGDNTGEYSIYEVFNNVEIMFHVSTMLPLIINDNNQQIERKRHIGNDRVVIIFQDENTPFSPHMITSKVTHVYLIIQPILDSNKDETIGYKVKQN